MATPKFLEVLLKERKDEKNRDRKVSNRPLDQDSKPHKQTGQIVIFSALLLFLITKIKIEEREKKEEREEGV
jgi:hypothetical protein